MMKNGKRKVVEKIFCIMLSICMVIGMLPATAFAEEKESAVNITAVGNDTITVTEPEKPNEDNKDSVLVLGADTQEIDRDYSQEITITVLNQSDAPNQYYLTCDNKNEDLYMNFVQSGSKDAPLTIQAGETQNVVLSVFAQNAVKTDYRVGITAHIANTEDVVFLDVAFRCRDIGGKVEVTKGTTSETTLAMDYTVKNIGKEKITDTTLSLSGEISEYARISPSVENMELDPGKVVAVTVIPDLTKMKADNKAKIEGVLNVSGGASAETEVSVDASGKEITSTTMSDLALIQDGNPFADMEFCEDESLSFSTNIDGNERNFSDITAEYWEEGNPDKNGIDTEDELKSVVGTLFDENGMINFTISDNILYDNNKSMNVSITVTSDFYPESGSGRSAKRAAASNDSENNSVTYIDEKGDLVTETKIYMTLEEYYEYRDKIKGVNNVLNIATKWDNYFTNPESTEGKVVVNVVDKLQGTALKFPGEFIKDTKTYVDYSKISVGDLVNKYDDYNKFASGAFSKGISYAGKASNYINTATDIYDTAAVWSSPNTNITSGQRWGYTGLQIARNVNRYFGGKLLSKVGTSIGTAIGDGPGAVVGYFAGNIVSGLIGFGLDQWIKNMEDDFKLESGSAIYNDIYGHQCTNARMVKSDFYLPNYIDDTKPNIYATSRLYDGDKEEGYYVDKSSVGYDYYINGNKVTESENSGLTQIAIADLSDGKNYLKPGKNTLIRDYDTNPGSHYVTADSEITLIYPLDAPISYINEPKDLTEVRLLPDFAVYRENITIKETPVKDKANKIEVYVYNRGSHSGWVDVSVMDSDQSNLIGKEENLYMEAFSEKKLEFDWTPSVIGKVTLNVKLENKGLGMDERKSDNNEASNVVTVREWQVPNIDSIRPNELFSVEDNKDTYITAELTDTLDLREVNISVDGTELKDPSITWKGNKESAQAYAQAKNLTIGDHTVKVTAVYAKTADSTATVEKEQTLHIKSHTKIPFQTDGTVEHPEFNLLSMESHRRISAKISQDGQGWILTNDRQTEGHEESYYLITKCDAGIILTNLAELKDATLSLKEAKKVVIEKESEITDIRTDIRAIKINDTEYNNLDLGDFTDSEILLAGMDTVLINVRFNIGIIPGNTSDIEIDLLQNQTIKLSEYYTLYQIILDENGNDFKNCICIADNGKFPIWPDFISYDYNTGIRSILFSGNNQKDIATANEVEILLQSSNSLYCIDGKNYSNPICIDESANHKIHPICKEAEEFVINKVELNFHNQYFTFESDTINVPNGSYDLSISYIVNGERTSYKEQVDVTENDITIELPNTADIPSEYGTLKFNWPETLGNSANVSGQIERDGKVNYINESRVKNGEAFSWPDGKTFLTVTISGLSQDGYSQMQSEFSREFYLEKNENKNIEIGKEFNGKAEVSYPSGGMTAEGYCSIVLSDLKDQNENILSFFNLWGYQSTLYGEIVLKDILDPQKEYIQAFTINSIPYVHLSLPLDLPIGTYNYEIHISTEKRQSSGVFYNIVTETEGDGTITPESPQVLEGQDQTFTVIPNNGNSIKDVIVDGVSVGNITNYTFKNVMEDHSIKAIFSKIGSVGPGSTGNLGDTPTSIPTTEPTGSPTGTPSEPTPTPDTPTGTPSQPTPTPDTPTGTPDAPTTTVVEKPDGSKTETTVSTVKKEDGSVVQTTEVINKDAAGNITSSSVKTTISAGFQNGGASIVVNVSKDGKGKITNAAAKISGTSSQGTQKALVSGSTIRQIVEIAGTKNVKVTIESKNGSQTSKVVADTADLTAGKKLSIVIKKSNGAYVLVNAKTYTVTKDGDVYASVSGNRTYELVNSSKMDTLSKKILQTIKVKYASKTIRKSKTTKMAFKNTLNMDNIKSIKYTVSKKSIATVTSKGVIKGKKVGTAVVKAKVTLKNGKAKTLKMKVRVKK